MADKERRRGNAVGRGGLDEYQLVNSALADACAMAGSQWVWAQQNGISSQLVRDVLRGRRAPSERLARALGYRRVVSFQRIEP